MCEPPSDTSDEQRFDEMFIHLTPRGATVPYNVCIDSDENVWVSSKGGLFKFDGKTRKTLWKRNNLESKKMAPFPQVLFHNDKIIATCSEHSDKMTELRYFTLNGEMIQESFIDGLLVSMTVSKDDRMYITKMPNSNKSTIYRTDVDTPIGWDEVITIDNGEAFYAIHSIDENTLIATVASQPLHQFSKQKLVFIDVEHGKITKSFSSAGRNDGEIFFPRTIRSYENGIVLLDKSGRFLHFDENGTFVEVKAEIDAFLANGFCIKNDEALMALSGIVRNPDGETICDDWLEFIKLNGTSWRKLRHEKMKKK